MEGGSRLNFNRVLGMQFGSYSRPLPLTNSFGQVWPALHDPTMIDLLGIKPGDRVLDIGGGSQPFSRADVVTEPYLESGAHRGGRAVAANFKYVECFAESLPFADKEFDFAMCRQVLEHTNDPAAALREMMRVARRGFIETPLRNYDMLMGPNPSHQWFVSVCQNTLVLERRRFIRHPFRHLGLSILPSSSEGQFLLHWEFKNLTNAQFYWEDHFEYEVIDDPNGFSYQNPDHAAEAHLDSALGGLLFPGSPMNHREADAREALRYRPNWALAHNTLGILLWAQQRYQEAQASFRTAAELNPNCPEYALNANLAPGTSPTIVDFPDTLPMDEAFMKPYLTPGGINMHKFLKGPAR